MIAPESVGLGGQRHRQLVAEAQSVTGTGNVAVLAVWSGDPGRSSLVGLALTGLGRTG